MESGLAILGDMTDETPDRKVVGIRAREAVLSKIVGEPVTIKRPQPSCCDESEGMTVEEQRQYKGERTPPYPPGQRAQFDSLFRKDGPNGSPTR